MNMELSKGAHFTVWFAKVIFKKDMTTINGNKSFKGHL